MSEFADYANDIQSQSLEDLLDYESGNLSFEDAVERGIVDEQDGSITTDVTTWGVHDIHSLEQELIKCELAFLANTRREVKTITSKWVSNGKLYSPSEMTTKHLENAIKYAERNQIKHPILKAMKNELKKRSTE